MKKLINTTATIILLYFSIGGIIYLGGKGHSGKGIFSSLTYPLEILYTGAVRFKAKGFRFFHTDRIVPRVKTLNKLKEPIYLLHTNPEATTIELINLKSSERIAIIDISKDIPLSSINARPMLTLDSINNFIYCNLHDGQTLYKYDFDGILIDEFHFNFTIHHRSEVFDGRFFCNIRREITLPGFDKPIDDEGFAEINLDGSIKNIFWLAEQTEYLNELQKHVSFTSWATDPFHLNDVELVYGVNNQSDSTKLMNEDILLSARHLSAILWIRNNSIIKIFKGSFNLQHDVDVISDSIISISNNNSAGSYVNLAEVHSNVIHYNICTRGESVFFNNIKFSTKTEGQVQYLPSGRVVIENQNSHEIIVIFNDSVIYRGGIDYKLDSSYSEFISWAPAFDYNPFDKQN